MQRALKLHGADLMGRELYVDAAVNKPADAIGQSGKPVDGCWFCLSNPNADVNLLASIGTPCCLIRICAQADTVWGLESAAQVPALSALAEVDAAFRQVLMNLCQVYTKM